MIRSEADERAATAKPVSAAVPRRTKALLVGVGGQGVLTAAKILGDAAHLEGQPVVVGQLHGMTQRGGSVESALLLGEGKSSQLSDGIADVLIAFEPLEAARAAGSIGPKTHVVVNRGRIVPFELTRRGGTYPDVDRILDQLGEICPDLITVDGPRLIEEVGVGRTLNVLMLGVVAGLDLLPLPQETIWRAVERQSPPRYLEANRKAFLLGATWVETR